MSRLRRKSNSTKSSGSGPSKKQKTINLGYNNDDDNIDSDDEEEDAKINSSSDNDDVEEEETLDAKKVRLARQYLRKLEADESDDSSEEDDSDEDDDDDDNEQDRIGLKLQKERLKLEGNLETTVADKVDKSLNDIRNSLKIEAGVAANNEFKEWESAGHIKLLRGHDLTPTCVALQTSGAKAVSGSKDHSVILWDIERECKDVMLQKHWKNQENISTSRTQGEVLSIACSDDGRYVAAGKRNATVAVFDVRAGRNNLVHEFTGHKGPVTCLAFRMQSLQLFSGSDDRCIRHYNLNEMMYVETLYGHQAGVMDIDCHRKERPISVGRDRTARAWKLAEDTHLIFRGGSKISSADCVSCLKEDWYITGHDDGHLGLWMTDKKKAVATIDAAHGSLGSVGRGIECVSALRGSDLAITGSSDGYLRLWKVMTGQTLATRSLEPLNHVPLPGYVNGIAVGPKAKFCVVASGQEPSLGRWSRISGAKNRFGIVQLRVGHDIMDDGEEDADKKSEEVPNASTSSNHSGSESEGSGSS